MEQETNTEQPTPCHVPISIRAQNRQRRIIGCTCGAATLGQDAFAEHIGSPRAGTWLERLLDIGDIALDAVDHKLSRLEVWKRLDAADWLLLIQTSEMWAHHSPLFFRLTAVQPGNVGRIEKCACGAETSGSEAFAQHVGNPNMGTWIDRLSVAQCVARDAVNYQISRAEVTRRLDRTLRFDRK